MDCFAACPPNDDACFDGCLNGNPVGAQLYMTMIECVICGACVLDCNGGQQC
jgi:hypothetical protein